MDEELLLFDGAKEPDAKSAWDRYEQGLLYMSQLNVFDTIRSNRNFYIGK